jgi:hypothetical protein
MFQMLVLAEFIEIQNQNPLHLLKLKQYEMIKTLLVVARPYLVVFNPQKP